MFLKIKTLLKKNEDSIIQFEKGFFYALLLVMFGMLIVVVSVYA